MSVLLAKFPALHAGIGDFWLDPAKVDSIWPLLGLPQQDPPLKVRKLDLSEARVIGCRVSMGVHTFDVAVLPDELAVVVDAAKRTRLAQLHAGAAASPLH